MFMSFFLQWKRNYIFLRKTFQFVVEIVEVQINTVSKGFEELQRALHIPS